MDRARLPLSVWLIGVVALAGCTRVAVHPPEPVRTIGSVEVGPEDKIPTAWKSVIKDPDVKRLDGTRSAWDAAFADARRAGFAKEIKAEGELLDPAAALPRAAPPPGPYSCRVFKLGKAGRGRAYMTFKPFDCYVEAEGELLTIVKQTGSQRPAGRLWPDSDQRMIFLGANSLDDDHQPPAYGAEDARDVVGYVERVAPFRWRMVMPWPRAGSKLDILELIPIPPEVKPTA